MTSSIVSLENLLTTSGYLMRRLKNRLETTSYLVKLLFRSSNSTYKRVESKMEILKAPKPLLPKIGGKPKLMISRTRKKLSYQLQLSSRVLLHQLRMMLFPLVISWLHRLMQLQSIKN